jgi:hypothetical protein
VKADCWVKGGGKEGQGPKGKGKGELAGMKRMLPRMRMESGWLLSRV